jgi:hypothetical protein
MAIYEGSRYTNVYAYEEEYKGKIVQAFHSRLLQPIDLREAFKHTWIESDRLDLLSNRYYGDPQYWWFLLDANSRYMEEHDINNGDEILIPPFEELRRVIEEDGD